MDENTLSYKLNRIDEAVTRIRTKTNTTNEVIENVATAVEDMVIPTGKIEITENRTYDVTNYASANVNVSSSSAKVKPMSISFRDYSTTEDLDLSMLDTSLISTFGGSYSSNGMFYNCKTNNIIFGDNFDTSNGTDMRYMFSGCSSLTSLDLSSFDTSKVGYMSNMFSQCSSLTSLNLSNFNTSNVTDMSRMFSHCSSLTSLDVSSFNASKVTDMRYMFEGCSSLTNLNLSSFDTSNVTDMQYMFYFCSSLTSLDLSNFNALSLTNITGMFDYCSSLTNINGCLNNLGQAYDTSNSANYSNYTLKINNDKLTKQSIINILNGLYDIATKGVKTQSLILGSTNLAKLTAEEIAIATNKGWNVS